MAPNFVTPYGHTGKHGKNDAADAAALCKAVTRPHMRFVPVLPAVRLTEGFGHTGCVACSGSQ